MANILLMTGFHSALTEISGASSECHRKKKNQNQRTLRFTLKTKVTVLFSSLLKEIHSTVVSSFQRSNTISLRNRFTTLTHRYCLAYAPMLEGSPPNASSGPSAWEEQRTGALGRQPPRLSCFLKCTPAPSRL